MEQAADERESSWGRCTWQVRLMMASFSAWELGSNGVSRTEDRDGLCVSIFPAIRSPISTLSSRIKVIRPMTNNTSWYRLADT